MELKGRVFSLCSLICPLFYFAFFSKCSLNLNFLSSFSRLQQLFPRPFPLLSTSFRLSDSENHDTHTRTSQTEEVWRLNEFPHTPLNTVIAATDIDKDPDKKHEHRHLNTRTHWIWSNYSHSSLDTDEVECVYVLCVSHTLECCNPFLLSGCNNIIHLV